MKGFHLISLTLALALVEANRHHSWSGRHKARHGLVFHFGHYDGHHGSMISSYRRRGDDNLLQLIPERHLRSTSAFIKPDECQPRDEFAANNKGRTCQRKCDTDNDCLNDRKLCLCDGVCGLSCIRPEKECQELPDPPHGQVHLTGRHFNDRAVYTCDDGYQIVGLEQVICNSDGQWSGAQPSCKQASTNAQSRYYCGEPKHIPNAKHNGSKEQLFYDLDTELTYSCLTGYQRKGFQEAQCFFYNDTARWFGPDLECHPIDCGPPELILNGKRKGDCTTYRCQITYECVPGFELVGKDTRYCQGDGTWTPSELPTCVPVQCAIPDSPVNGKAMFTAVAYKSVVSYECKYGFMIVGDATRTCGEDKLWSGVEPQCKEINCGSPGFLPNGWLEGSRTTLHAVVTFRCIEGMTFNGSSFRTTCQADGKWSHPLPQCYAPCIVPNIGMGNVVNLTIGAKIQHGENIVITCSSNYEIPSNKTPIDCHNGTWSQIPKCEPARCKTLPSPPLNGMVVVPSTSHGGTGLYQCKDGYVLKGPNITKCNFGNWTEVTPSCELVYCPFPGYIDNGKVLLVGNMGLYDYRPYVRKVMNNRQILFECGKGHKLDDGPPGATCVDGRWSPPNLPRCVSEFHPKMVEWKRKKRETLDHSANDHGSLMNFHLPRRIKRAIKMGAKYGEIEVRNPKLRYRRGHKSANLCSAIEDENMNIETIKSGRDSDFRDASPMSNPGTILKLKCAKGYELSIPKKKIRCKKGEWRPAHPECLPRKCRLPRLFEGGKFKLENVILPNEGEIEHGKEVDLECDQGYFLSGPERRRCWFGEWTGSAETPKCVGNPCEILEIPGGGRYIGNGGNYRPGQLIPHNALIEFECDEVKNVIQPLQCNRGKLTPEPPECFVADKAKDVQKKATLIGVNDWLSSLAISASSHLVKNGDIQDVLDKAHGADTHTGIASSLPQFLRAKASCPQPSRTDGSLIYATDSHEPLSIYAREVLQPGTEIQFPHGTQVKFDCLPATLDEEEDQGNTSSRPSGSPNDLLRSWMIVCEDGHWVGQSQGCDEQGRPLLQDEVGDERRRAAFNASCSYQAAPVADTHLVVFHNDRELFADDGEHHFEPGVELLFRCEDIGKYILEGSQRRRCIGGVWDGIPAVCRGLNQLHDYAPEIEPTILLRHKNGEIAQSNDGKLVVTPGTIVHMECLWVRRNGSPSWSIDNYSGRTYPQGWTQAPGRNAQLEYRLSIYHARVNDTGTYTCTTPEGLSHSIIVDVKEVTCPEIVPSEGLRLSDPESRELNARIHFTCANNNDLIGKSPLTCLPSGRWDLPVPACMDVICPESIIKHAPPSLQVHVESFGVGGKVSFSCGTGYRLTGPPSAQCLPTGQWTISASPRCLPIMCPDPESPANGFATIEGPSKIGNIVTYHCQPGYMLQGRPISACTAQGKWSGQMPSCVRACAYPGAVIGGTISVVKFYYQVGETVSFDCHPGLNMAGAKRLECLGTGIWSGPVPICST